METKLQFVKDEQKNTCGSCSNCGCKNHLSFDQDINLKKPDKKVVDKKSYTTKELDNF